MIAATTFINYTQEPLENKCMVYLTIAFPVYSMKKLSPLWRQVFFFLAAFIPYNEVETKVTPAEQVSQAEPLSLLLFPATWAIRKPGSIHFSKLLPFNGTP